MDYKGNLLFEQSEEEKLVPIDIRDITTRLTKKTRKTTSKNFSEVIENIDLNDIVRHFLGVKSYLNEHGFMDTMQMSDLTKIMKDNFIEYETLEESAGEDYNFDDMSGGYEMMPLEEKCLYDK